MNILLIPGTTCVAEGRVLQIDGADSVTHMRARDVATGALVTVPIAKLEPLPRSAARQQADVVPEAEWTRCAAMAKDLLALPSCLSVDHDTLVKLADKHDCSIRTLQRARAALRREERASALVRSRGGRPLGTSCLPAEVETVVRHTIQKHYLRRERPTKTYIVERARSLARRLGLPPPSRKAVLLRLRREQGWASDMTRLGSRAAKQKWEPRTGTLAVDRPLELIQIDHTPADVLVLSDDRSTVIGRPWVTVAIDVASRCVLGMHVSMNAPSAVSVALCIEHSVLPKRENAEDPQLWPMYGKPQRILVDNGKDFRSLALQRGCQDHGIELSWRPVRTPHYGAHIERLIGTLMKIAHLLPGTTFSNTKERGEYDSAKQARLTLDEFRQWITIKVCSYYHVQRHRALGVPPLVAWERGLTNREGVLVPPPLLAAPLDFRMDFLPYEFRQVRRTGIELFASRYWHGDLGPLINSQDPIMVRYDPRDPGQVWIRRPDGVLVTAPAIAGRAVARPGSRLVLDATRRAELEATLDAGFEATDFIEQAAATATRQARQPGRGRARSGHGRRKSELEMPGMTLAVPAMRPSSRPSITVEEWN